MPGNYLSQPFTHPQPDSYLATFEVSSGIPGLESVARVCCVDPVKALRLTR